ncbi:MAG: serine/threonine protein kinase [Acidobacteria bacterium]|nr:MAG: serine/threonine protein kinase [Acidobacteriota bacterium]REJ99273.1 MAG: serine/threonine protein kinase [Acidobacteriota bacterium]REK16006.1 MAG: serine/threonine protein kinase [Acidobacteriota bacterium]REK43687.1 MAG: serine/threonine protein kinase [Acidobacteriota bacterium]
MNEDQRKQVRQIFGRASELESADLDGFLRSECGDDKEVLSEVRSLLHIADNANSFLEGGAICEIPEIAEEILAAGKLNEGEMLGHFRILKLIGRGGMGEIYLAKDTKLNRKVAIKLLREDLSRDPEKTNRFLQEMQAASSLNHPNILTVYESGQTGERRFIVTEFVDGNTLRELVGKENTIPEPEALEIGIQLSEALAAAHRAGIVHRDVKPENVMIREDGYIKVLDFGLAKLRKGIDPSFFSLGDKTLPLVDTVSGMLLGTVAYMSPEQAKGEDTDERTDIWSVGVVLYEMLAGKVPFEGPSVAHRMMAIIDREPDELVDVNEGVWNIVHRTLAKDPADRYQSVEDLLFDLKSLAQELEPRPQVQRLTRSISRMNIDTGDELEKAESTDGGLRNTGRDRQQAVSTHLSTAQRVYAYAQNNRAFAGLALLIIVPLLAVAGYYSYNYYVSSTTPPPLTDKDEILLTEFENTTGEEILDGTMKSALTIALNQSPFLKIYPNAEIEKTLKLMKREPGEPITKEVAAEICKRRNLKAYVAGTISRIGEAYLVDLSAMNGQTGEVIAAAQVPTTSQQQDEILDALSEAASDLRAKLGESLATIKRTDRPLEEVTTSSLEALRAYSDGVEAQSRNDAHGMMENAERAVKMDPGFAMGWKLLSTAYRRNRMRRESIEAASKAFELRDRLPDRERLSISAFHYGVTFETEKEVSAYEELRAKYPRDVEAVAGLAYIYQWQLGQFRKALKAAEEAVRLDPSVSQYHIRVVDNYIALGRYEEAKRAIEFAAENGANMNFWVYRRQRFDIAVIQDDEDELKRQNALFEQKGPNHPGFGELALFKGKYDEGKRLYDNYVAATMKHSKSDRGTVIGFFDLHSAMIRMCDEARKHAVKPEVEFPHFGTMKITAATAVVLAMCGDAERSREIISSIRDEYPDTKIVSVEVSWPEAVLALEENRPRDALVHLEGMTPYHRAFNFWYFTLKGRAYLALGEHDAARREFQTILDNQGLWPVSPLYPLAQLGKARAMKSKKEYESFFEMWKDADEDLPDLIAARKEYAEL